MVFRRAPEPNSGAAEDATDAIVDADRTYRPGTAQAALRHRDFRFVWGGTFLSNVGTWMQNVILGVFALRIGDAGYVGLLYFAQLGPLLFLSQIGGVIADQLNRRRYLVVMQTAQMILSFGLAALAAVDHPNKTSIFLCVLAIGIANALSAPAMGAILPTLVPREDLPGAVSLQSVQMNLSRVIGSAIGGALYAALGIQWVFAINAATYAFAVAGLVLAHYDARNPNPVVGGPLEKLLSGFRIAWRDPLLRRIFVTMFTFSFFCLMYVGLFPELAKVNLGISLKTDKATYGLLYGVWALGAALGAFDRRDLPRPPIQGDRHAVLARGLRRGARRVLPDPQRAARVRRVAVPRLRVLPGDHRAVDGAPGAPRRRGTRAGHGRVGDELRGTVPIGVYAGGLMISALGMSISRGDAGRRRRSRGPRLVLRPRRCRCPRAVRPILGTGVLIRIKSQGRFVEARSDERTRS